MKTMRRKEVMIVIKRYRVTLFSLSLCLLLTLVWLTQAKRQEAAAQETTTEQSFNAPEPWAQQLTRQQGWGPEHPRMLADVNGDHRQDIVGFGSDGVWTALSNSFSFYPAYVLGDFGYNSGWRVARHVRLTGDINGDGLEDIVGFGEDGVYRALSTGSGFGPVTRALDGFGYNTGWRVDKHVRLLADVNGDGRKDIVAFGEDGVWLSLATADGYFTAPKFAVWDLGYNQGWRIANHIRTTADVNGDGLQDIVGFGDGGVWTALSTGDGFGPAQFVFAGYGYNAGNWRVDRHPRFLADVDRDGKQDIVGFGDAGVYVSRSTGSGFEEERFVIADFGYNSAWRVGTHPRFVADLNGDGYPDIVGFGEESIYRSLGGPNGFGAVRGVLRELVVERGSPWNNEPNTLSGYFPRLVGDVHGDGKQDLIAFDNGYVKVVPSNSHAPLPPPVAPSNLRVTAKTDTTLTIAWDDHSVDARRFFINHGESSASRPRAKTVDANTTSHVFSSLDPNKLYCFTVYAESIYSLSAGSNLQCESTNPIPENKGPFTTTIYMEPQIVEQGYVPFYAEFGPFSDGATILSIKFPTQYPVSLVKVRPGNGSENCGEPDAVVVVHGLMTADQEREVWGTDTLSISGNQVLPFLGCAPIRQSVPVNITWRKP